MRSAIIAATVLTLSLALLAGCNPPTDTVDRRASAAARYQDTGKAARVSEDKPTVLQLVDENEPGDPLILTGRVFRLDGTMPLPGARLDVYHTDAGGYYTRPVSRARDARIRGSVWTDADGRFEIHTIMPGHYPSLNEAAHIHVHLGAPGVPDHWIASFIFAGDPYLSDRDIERNEGLGRFSPVVELEETATGELKGERDIRLDPELAEANALVDGWYRGE